MDILIAAVCRWKSDPARALYDDYAARSAWPIVLREVEEKRKLPEAALKEREAALLLATLPRRDCRVVALDGSGRGLSSPAFAALLGGWRDAGTATLAFLIGGAAGHGSAVPARADLVLSLGPPTWPHLLVRGLIAEQLYRAQQILAGHPYHRA
jgi:23S rRNA (pseudouridine1915-N3)-methyltransferase